MENLSYCRIGQQGISRNCRAKGFRVNHQQRKFSVYRLQKSFLYVIRRFSNRWWNWKSSCGEALRLLIRRCSSRRSRRRKSNSSRKNPETSRSTSRGGRNIIDRYDYSPYKLRSCLRSNSFYAEAIDDCLEFIKHSSRSTDEENSITRRSIKDQIESSAVTS